MALELKIEDTFTYKKGKIEGENKKRDRMILALYENTKLSIQKIALTAEVSEQYVLDLIKESCIEEVNSKRLPKKKK
jgi:transposase-like protein